MRMCDTCDDSRFELIEKYKQKLLDATNIEDSPEEMAVIDNILFRFWQMGWIKDEPSTQPVAKDINVPVNDCISRETAIETVRKAKSIGQAHRMLAQLPSAQPETAKRIVGKAKDGMTLWYQCDMCNEPVDAQDAFCRGCGRRLTDG